MRFNASEPFSVAAAVKAPPRVEPSTVEAATYQLHRADSSHIAAATQYSLCAKSAALTVDSHVRSDM